MIQSFNKLVYGKDERERITGIELGENDATIYYSNGTSEIEEFERYIVFKSHQLKGKCGKLHGEQAFKHFSKYKSKKEFWEAKRQAPYPHYFCPRDDHQQYMLKTGATMYKGMKYDDLTILSFDIETNGLLINNDSVTYMISATMKDAFGRSTKLFSLDNYSTQQDMIRAFCAYVTAHNPDVLTGHNILGYDIPFLQKCYGKQLPLGRDGSGVKISGRERIFRKDGHRTYSFTNAKVHGREIVDTFYLAMKYDFQNKYNSYGLKSIIEQEGMITEGRQFYDAATIKDNWKIDSERQKIKEYCINDSQDSLNLCDLMLPNYFYYVQALPLGLQEAVLTATGSQINAIMVRSYLQDRMAIPEASESSSFEGAISFGNPGIYSDINKVDVASLYPSIILEYGIFDRKKDPQGNFLNIVKELTTDRLKNKALAKETGDRYYSDMEQAQKILINSAYGFMGAPGLNFNSPENAAKVTRYGREILQKGIDWVSDKGYTLVNVDTDSFAYTTSSRLSERDFEAQLDEINALFPDGISWENDGQFKRFIVVKTKNYVLQDYEKNVVIKGSGLKATMKEPALKEFIAEFITRMLNNQRENRLIELYNDYAKEILDIDDITRWSSKKTITKAILTGERTNETKIREAFQGQVFDEGDRIYTFFDHDDSICLNTNFVGTYSVDRLLLKLYNTVKIFSTVFDISVFPNYKLKRNKELLAQLEQPDLAV